MTREMCWWQTEAQIPQDISGDLWQPSIDDCIAAIEPSLRPAIDLDGALLDLGCGIGRLAIPLAATYTSKRVVGVDVSERMLTVARERSRAEGLHNVLWMRGDGRTLPYDGQLSACWSMLVFQHLPHETVSSYIGQIACALNPGGVLRFQHVLGSEDTFLSHQTTVEEVTRWCGDAGLSIRDIDEGLMIDPWIWVTAVKP